MPSVIFDKPCDIKHQSVGYDMGITGGCNTDKLKHIEQVRPLSGAVARFLKVVSASANKTYLSLCWPIVTGSLNYDCMKIYNR